jgi:serine/threonine-protein kinase
MGEVFRARDARLKRDVALKVLPLTAVSDPDRRSRFDREAQVLASLNHPNIAQVFGVEESDGAPVIVMELVEGPTLADRIEGLRAKGSGLPIADALTIASQICDGLEAAHERGVIHRDLKPANIKVRPDGAIKILDFGLARVLTEDAHADDPANSPTMAGADTGVGIVLGTAAYMSPEQARGRAVDKRTDIWAFGCVLYEMLTGSAAFSGESTTDVLAAVVQRDPDLSQLPSRVPTRIVELLRRCLQKNPKDRLRDIADARYEIAEARESSVTSRQSPVTSHQPPVTRRSPGLLAALFVAGAAATAILLLTPALRTKPIGIDAPTRAVVALPADMTVALSRGSAVALSPDGRQLVFAGRLHDTIQLYLRALDRFETQPIAGTEDAANPFFSADGRWVGFFAAGKLKKVALDGGSPVALADVVSPRGEAWTADNTIIVTPSNNRALSRVSAVGGPLEPLTALRTGELSHRWPLALPGSSVVLFAIWNDSGWEPSRIAAQRLGQGTPTVVVDGNAGYPRYVRDEASRRGYLVYARAEGLLAAPFDEAKLALSGTPVPVVDGLITNLSGGAHFDLSASGTLAYVRGNSGEAERDLAWVTLDGRAEPAAHVPGLGRAWTLSADGTRVARNNTNGRDHDIWIEDLARRTGTKLSRTGGLATDNFNPVWSADGQWIALARGLPISNLYRHSASSVDVEERLTSSPNLQLPRSWSPDGRTLVYTEFDPASGPDLWVLTVPPQAAAGVAGSGPTGTVRPFVKTGVTEDLPAFSPDGRWIAYQSNDAGRFEVYVRRFPEGDQTIRVSTDGGSQAGWSTTGRDVYFRGPGEKMMAVAFDSAAARAGQPRVLFDATKYENTYAVAPDGRRLLMMPLLPAEQSATHINLVINFLAELRQRVK